MTTSLVIVGAGGFARETVELVRAINGVAPAWDLLGLLDDDVNLVGRDLTGARVIGTSAWLADRDDVSVVVCVGSPSNRTSRQRVVDRLDLSADRYATLIHPAATVPSSVVVGRGSVVHAGAVCTADVVIGRHVEVMPHVVFTHDDEIGDYSTFGAGALIAGRVRVGAGAYIGSGAAVRENVTIGERSMIGMGSVVLADVPDGQTWAGVPAVQLNPVPRDPTRLAVE